MSWVPLTDKEQTQLHRALINRSTDLSPDDRLYLFAVLVLGERPVRP